MSSTEHSPTSASVLLDRATGAGLGSDHRDPFRVFGIVGFVMSLFAIVNIAALVISIIALVRSKRAGFRNRFALAGVFIAGIGVLITIGIVVSVGVALVDAAQTCARLGDGVHTIGNATYTCTASSFHVSTGP